MASTPGDLYDLLPLLASEAVQIGTGLQKQALRIGGRRFLRETEAWRESTTDAGSPSGYSGTPQVLRVLTVSVAGSQLGLGSYRYSQVNGLTIDGGGSGTTLCVFLPLRDSDEYPEFIIQQYGEGIVAAAQVWLKTQINKPWSDPQGAQEHERIYQEAVRRAKGLVSRGQVQQGT